MTHLTAKPAARTLGLEVQLFGMPLQLLATTDSSWDPHSSAALPGASRCTTRRFSTLNEFTRTQDLRMSSACLKIAVGKCQWRQEPN